IMTLQLMSLRHTHLRIAAGTTFVIGPLLTMTIVSREPARMRCARELIRGGDHAFQTKADGVHRNSGRVAAGSLDGRSASRVGGCKDRADRTSDRVAAKAAQGTSARDRADAKEDRAGGSQSGGRARPFSGRAARCCGNQGSANSAPAGKGEDNGGRLSRRGDGVGPTQPG